MQEQLILVQLHWKVADEGIDEILIIAIGVSCARLSRVCSASTSRRSIDSSTPTVLAQNDAGVGVKTGSMHTTPKFFVAFAHLCGSQ